MAIQKITSGILADGAIVAADIADGSITTAKIADANVTAAKLATGAALPSQSGNTTYYLTTDGTNSIWKAQTALAVANTQITGNITGSQISSNTLSNTVFQTGSVENYMSAQGLGFGMRNRIINGAMVIDQRNAGASINPTDGQFSVDRFMIFRSVTSKLTAQQNAGSVTPPAGFTNYLGITSSSAYTVTSSDYFMICQRIEGYNIADWAWGTANAKTVTLSFWVRSSLTGTFGASIQNGSQNRAYPFTYTISSANTWEQKTITIAGDTTGTWSTTNTEGLGLYIGLGMGTTYSGTAGAWASSTYYSATGATSVVGTNGATFYITGVQLEVGSTATSFDYRPYGTELQLCQRYYEKSYPYATVPGASGAGSTIIFVYPNGNGRTGCSTYFKVSKRASPTVTSYDEPGNSGKLTYMDNGHNFTATQNHVSTEAWSVQGPNSTNNSGVAFHYVAVAEL